MSPNSSHSSSAGGSSRGSSPFSRAHTPDAEALEAYEQLMASLIPPSTLPRPPTPLLTSKLTLNEDEADEDSVMGENGVKRPMTKAEKQNAKKKRRKERERAARMEAEAATKTAEEGIETEQNRTKDSVVEFRLFSSCPIKPISLLPASEDYPIPLNPRHLPLPEVKLQNIRKAATEAAVKFPALGGPSCTHERWTRKNISPREVLLESSSGEDAPCMFIGVSPRPLAPHADSAIISSNGKCIPVVPLKTSEIRTKPSLAMKRTRRGRRHKTIAAPRFWAPPVGVGGKARGYAFGYRDSREGRREGGWHGYLRNK
ncbi:hypothetical protein C348_04688 [Cryptococcus neoformans Gb118]|nr:hypothetical protein C350_04442 [Cryptococcus neoformans var. grubii MW-RSA36]OXL06894.1 hypothetical protein C348_04688 [Cryptococcus neoformans var. grubii Gb118]